MPDRVALVTLGMHRSGTSALSGVLARLGCDTPATPMTADTRNTKGFYESRPISELNNVILSSAGTTWDDWSAVDAAWFDSPRRATFAEQARDLVESEFGASPLIVLKDPRISLLVPFWLDVLRGAGYVPRVVFAYRSALDVAASLAERNGFDPALGCLLWLRYVLEAEHASRDIPRVFVGYDRLLADWRAEVSRIETQLDLRLPRRSPQAREEVEEFLTPSMRHHRAGADGQDVDTAPHRWIRGTHAVLDRWTRDGESLGDRPSLDEIRAEFDGATPAFDRMMRLAKERTKSDALLRTQLNAALADANAEIASLQDEMKRRAEILLTYEQEIADLNQALADLSKLQVEFQKKLDAAETAAINQKEADAELLRGARNAAAIQKRKHDAKLARANSKIDKLVNSRSFRMTAPFRRLSSWLARR